MEVRGARRAMGTWFPTYSQAPVVPVRQAALTVSMYTVLLTQNGVAMGTPSTHTYPCVKVQVFLSSVFSSTSVRSSW